MRFKPYIGITGPATIDEVKYVVEEFQKAGYNLGSGHPPMIGFLVSHKTLSGEPTKNRRYPKVETLRVLLEEVGKRAFTTLHYNSKEQSTLAAQLQALFGEGIYEEALCRAVQLNIVNPDICQIGEIKSRLPDLRIIFQVSHKTMGGRTPREVAQHVLPYSNFISYILIDPSGGKGAEFDIGKSLQIYEALKERLPLVTIGFAGGFTGDNVAQRTRTLIERLGTSDFCIDAEGGLRDKVTDAYGDDLFNREKVRRYIETAAKALK